MPQLEHLFASIAKGDLNRLIVLLKRTPQSVNVTEEENISLLHYAVLQDRPEIVIYLTNIPECLLTPKDKHYGHTPLHMACFHGNHRMAQHLLTKLNPSEVNIQDKFGWTPLHHAVRIGNLDLCLTLIRYRAKPDIKNELGKTPLHYAAQHGYLEILKELYELVPSSLVTPSPNECFALPVPTLLHLAVLNNHQSVANWLQYQLVYPPNVKYQRSMSLKELPEDTALARGHTSLRNTLHAYRQQYETWMQDINGDHTPLNHVKLCLCGPPDSGKTSLRESLERGLLQLFLGWEPDTISEGESGERVTYGIDIKSLHIAGTSDTYHVWDFSGASSYFATHHFFLTTDHTLYTVVVDLSKPLPEVRSQLLQWLEIIKMHNLGSTQLYQHKDGSDTVRLSPKASDKVSPSGRSRAISLPAVSRFRSRFSSVSSTLKPAKISHSVSPSEYPSSSTPHELGITSPFSPSTPPSFDCPVVTPVPVLVVGSHFDLVPDAQKPEVLQQMDRFVHELSSKLNPLVELIPSIVPINCQKPSSSDIKLLKEQIALIRAFLMENEKLYPKVFDKVIKQIETIKSQDVKVMKFDEFCINIQTNVNRLLSDRQISYILSCLSNAGLVTYIEQGALSQWVFINPSWLCQDFLGHVLAPPTYSTSSLKSYKSHILTEEQITSALSVCSNRYYTSLVPELLLNFEVCGKVRSISSTTHYIFPAFLSADSADISWDSATPFKFYIGRWLLVIDQMEFLPPGFFARLQVQVCSFSTSNVSVCLRDDSVIVHSALYQCLVKISHDSRSIDLIGRINDSSLANTCLQLLDHIHGLIVKLARQMSPSIFFEWRILSSSDLRKHSASAHSYSTSEVADALKSEQSVWNKSSQCLENMEDLLFFGERNIMNRCIGRLACVTFLHEDIFEQLEVLLSGEDEDHPGWKVLAKQLNLSDYIELLKMKDKPVKSLILKWGEKPRWTVDNLLYALNEIQRKDVYNLLRAKTDKKYIQN